MFEKENEIKVVLDEEKEKTLESGVLKSLEYGVLMKRKKREESSVLSLI